MSTLDPVTGPPAAPDPLTSPPHGGPAGPTAGPAATAAAPSARRRRTGLVAAAAVVAVLLVVVVVALVARPRTYDRGTPEGVVQAYVAAVVDGDSVAAAALLASGSPCAATDLDTAYVAPGTRVDLVGTDVQGDRALVRVNVSVDTLEPVPGPGETRTIRLTRTADGWRVDGIPWPLYQCTGA